MKGILLAGGMSRRLYPATTPWVNKQFLPVYNKPMIYYPLSMMMLAGIRDILVITTEEGGLVAQRMLGSGKQWGLHFEYAQQKYPRGIADAFRVGNKFIENEAVCLMLGDNIFHGHGMPAQLQKAAELKKGAVVFAYAVKDPERYGVVEFDKERKAISIEEKPKNPRSNYAVPGIYFYDNQITDIVSSLVPSDRGELEITDVNNIYINKGQLKVEIIGRGTAWLDAGTHEALIQASNYIRTIEERQGILVASPEETAYRMGYICYDALQALLFDMPTGVEYSQRIAEIQKNEEVQCAWVRKRALQK